MVHCVQVTYLSSSSRLSDVKQNTLISVNWVHLYNTVTRWDSLPLSIHSITDTAHFKRSL